LGATNPFSQNPHKKTAKSPGSPENQLEKKKKLKKNWKMVKKKKKSGEKKRGKKNFKKCAAKTFWGKRLAI